MIDGLENSEEEDAAPKNVLKASRVFGEAKPSQPIRRAPQSQSAAMGGSSHQEKAEGGGSPADLRPGLSKGRAKRRKVILEDDDDVDHHVEGVATEDQPQGSWRSSSRGDSLSHLHDEVVPESSEDTPAKGNGVEAGASSKGATEHLIAQPKIQRSEIKPGSFYPTGDQLSTRRTVIDLEPKDVEEETKERVVINIEPEASKSNGVELLEDPVQHALKECEKIAAMLRKQLHIAEGATEGYSEVDAAAARLVTQVSAYGYLLLLLIKNRVARPESCHRSICDGIAHTKKRLLILLIWRSGSINVPLKAKMHKKSWDLTFKKFEHARTLRALMRSQSSNTPPRVTHNLSTKGPFRN